jgi:CHAD domain-containing protein
MSSSNLSENQDPGQKGTVKSEATLKSLHAASAEASDRRELRGTLENLESESIRRSTGPVGTRVRAVSGPRDLAPLVDVRIQQVPGAVPDAPTAVDATMTVVEVALANLRRYLSAWHLHEPGARLGDDPEELHDLRVAGRRLDAILRQFKSYLPAPLLQIRPALKTVLRALGDARDLDVALIELEAFSRGLPESERDNVEPLKRHLASESARARARMLSVLDSIWVRKSLQDLASLLAARPASQPSSGELVLNAAPGLIRRRYRKLRKGADLLKPDSSMEAYHAVRGRSKRLRYALEAVAVIYGKPADAMLRALRRWQERLGVQQDAAVASRRLKALASAPPKGIPPETLFLMGRLAEHYSSAAMRARKLSAKGYRKVRGRWKRLRVSFKNLAAIDPQNLPEPGT